MIPEEILETIKAVFTTLSESAKFLRSRKCRKIVEKFLEQFRTLVIKIDSLSGDHIEVFLSLLNGILQTINSVLGSNICH